jgi:hypothetical protein
MMGIGMASYEQWHHANKDEPVKQLLTSLWKGSRYWKVSFASYVHSMYHDKWLFSEPY